MNDASTYLSEHNATARRISMAFTAFAKLLGTCKNTFPRKGIYRGRSKRMAFNDGTVFIVGGASYLEYGNLEERVKKTGKRVTYGGTEIVDPGGFVQILEGLGKTSS